MDPHTLLCMARTNKTLRKYIMHPNAKPVWKKAWANVKGLPPCPDDVAAPALAELLFEKDCHVCRRSSETQDIWLIFSYASSDVSAPPRMLAFTGFAEFVTAKPVIIA